MIKYLNYKYWLQSAYKVYYRIFHLIVFYFNDIEYKNIPLFGGKLFIKNEGKCSMGSHLVFNSNFESNPIGLNKNCSVFIAKTGELTIGNNCGFSAVSIYCNTKIEIGDNFYCGGNVSIWDTDFHPLNYLDRRNEYISKIKSFPIKIGSDVFIGANSIILKGVTIGDRSIIGAGSVVTKNVPNDEIWGGNPAIFIKKAI